MLVVYQHQQNAKLIAELQETSAALDLQLNKIMSSMTLAHKELMMSVKMTSQETPLQHETVDYKVLVKYAERIAKFTRTAKTIDTTPSNTTTPNLPWPTVRLTPR